MSTMDASVHQAFNAILCEWRRAGRPIGPEDLELALRLALEQEKSRSRPQEQEGDG